MRSKSRLERTWTVSVASFVVSSASDTVAVAAVLMVEIMDAEEDTVAARVKR